MELLLESWEGRVLGGATCEVGGGGEGGGGEGGGGDGGGGGFGQVVLVRWCDVETQWKSIPVGAYLLYTLINKHLLIQIKILFW